MTMAKLIWVGVENQELVWGGTMNSVLEGQQLHFPAMMMHIYVPTFSVDKRLVRSLTSEFRHVTCACVKG